MHSAQKKFEYLQEMGIDLWQLRTSVAEGNSAVQYLSVEQENTITRFFADILHYFKLTIEDIIVARDVIHINQIKWQFSEGDTLAFQDNLLITPPLSKIAASTALKKALWKKLSELQ